MIPLFLLPQLLHFYWASFNSFCLSLMFSTCSHIFHASSITSAKNIFPLKQKSSSDPSNICKISESSSFKCFNLLTMYQVVLPLSCLASFLKNKYLQMHVNKLWCIKTEVIITLVKGMFHLLTG